MYTLDEAQKAAAKHPVNEKGAGFVNTSYNPGGGGGPRDGVLRKGAKFVIPADWRDNVHRNPDINDAEYIVVASPDGKEAYNLYPGVYTRTLTETQVLVGGRVIEVVGKDSNPIRHSTCGSATEKYNSAAGDINDKFDAMIGIEQEVTDQSPLIQQLSPFTGRITRQRVFQIDILKNGKPVAGATPKSWK